MSLCCCGNGNIFKTRLMGATLINNFTGSMGAGEI